MKINIYIISENGDGRVIPFKENLDPYDLAEMEIPLGIFSKDCVMSFDVEISKKDD